jgi:mono/diheme cytochrome c family protein
MMSRFAGVAAFVWALIGAACALAAPALAAAAPPPAFKLTAAELSGPPVKLVAEAPKGSLHNPYNGNAKVAKEGHKLFFHYGCNGCHGGGGGGGMCPPLINGVWIYGGSDDTLFRLISLGSDKLVKLGYQREALEDVIGPMPQMGLLIHHASDVFKIITWIRSAYQGPPNHKYH